MAIFDTGYGQHSHHFVGNCVNLCCAFSLTRLYRMANRVPDGIRYWVTEADISACFVSLTPIMNVLHDVPLRSTVAFTALSCQHHRRFRAHVEERRG